MDKEIFNLLIGALISSDNNYDINSCKKNLSTLQYLNTLDDFTSEQKMSIQSGISIVESDLKEYSK